MVRSGNGKSDLEAGKADDINVREDGADVDVDAAPMSPVSDDGDDEKKSIREALKNDAKERATAAVPATTQV